LLTAGEIMQLPPDEEIVLISGCPPIRARKARYYQDPELSRRILSPPRLKTDRSPSGGSGTSGGDWVIVAPSRPPRDPANGGIRREPELPDHEAIAPEKPNPAQEFETGQDDEPDDDAQRQRAIRRNMRAAARQTPLDPGDDMDMS
ncbi:MAG: type IV secretory system conjugative DNA transfer family protein, partial [Stellaceae bacterium]